MFEHLYSSVILRCCDEKVSYKGGNMSGNTS
jgi:hypothetical protein